MATTERQSVTIHYRRLEDPTGAFGGRTLHSALRRAMNHTVEGEKISEHWKRRAWIVPPAAEDTLLMNLHHDHRDHFFGDLTTIRRATCRRFLPRPKTPRCSPSNNNVAPHLS
jgi:hypothetical protein